MDFFSVLSMIGGLALFLYGMHVMGEGLSKVSGGKMEKILESLTSNPLKAVGLGALVTAVIQSSSATTVMVVGFVNSGIMKLSQAVGVIMGANIGTTITSWILSLSGIESDSFFIQLFKPTSFSPILAIIGVAFLLFAKSEKKERYRNHFPGLCCFDVWNGKHERCCKTTGRCAGIYRNSDCIFQSSSWYAGGSCAYRSDSEFFCISGYFTGIVRNWCGKLQCGDSHYSWTEYRNLCHSTSFCYRS